MTTTTYTSIRSYYKFIFMVVIYFISLVCMGYYKIKSHEEYEERLNRE